MQCPDLYLACGCVAQAPVALAAFDGRILNQTVPVLLHARLALSAGELDSLAGLVQSQLHLSLGRLLPSS
jgi:hypothetical protein